MKLSPFELEIIETVQKAGSHDTITIQILRKGNVEGSIEHKTKWFVAKSPKVLYTIEVDNRTAEENSE